MLNAGRMRCLPGAPYTVAVEEMHSELPVSYATCLGGLKLLIKLPYMSALLLGPGGVGLLQLVPAWLGASDSLYNPQVCIYAMPINQV